MTAVGIAAQAPGYVYERPLAVANVLTGADQQTGQKGVIDQVSDFVDDLPIAGDIARGVGNVLNESSQLHARGVNSYAAASLKMIAGMPDGVTAPAAAVWNARSGTSALDPLVEFVRGDKSPTDWTVGDLRRYLAGRGFTAQDEAELASGKTSTWDYGDRATSQNRLIDLAGRLVLDPVNATVIAGPGRIGSVLSKAPGASEAAQTADRLLRLSRGRAAVKGIPALSKRALDANDGVAALRGVVPLRLQRVLGVTDYAAAGAAVKAAALEGVTHRSLGLFLMGMGRGGSALLSGYRKAAVGTTLGQFAVNAVDDALADKSAVPGPLNDLFVLGRAIRDDRPLSEGMLFNLWSVMHFPARDMAYGVLGNGLGAYRRLNPKGRDIRAGLVDLYVPGPAATHRARDAQWLEMMGGEESALDYIAHLAKKTRAPSIAAAFTERPSFGSLAELQDHLRQIDGLVADEVRFRPPSRQEVRDAAVDFATSARGLSEAQAGLRTTFSPERAASDWIAWRAVASAASVLTDGAVVPKLQDVLVKEHLQVARERFRAAAAPDGTVSPAAGERILMDHPALLTHETAELWSRLLVRDHEPIPLSWIEQRLRKAEEDALSRRSVYGPAEEWEARAGREAAHRSGLVRDDGTLDLDRMPTEGKVRVSVPTAPNIGRRNAGFPARTLEEVQELRNDPRIADLEDASSIDVFDGAGYHVDMVKQGVAGRDGTLSPALEYTLGDSIDPQSAAEVATLTLRQAQSRGRARLVYAGEALDRFGLTANAVEMRWVVGGHDATQAEQALGLLNRLFDETFVDDTTGVYRVLLTESDIGTRIADKLDAASEGMAAIFPNRGWSGVFDAETTRVWTQTIRDTAQGNRRGRTDRVFGRERSAANVERHARHSANWWAARGGFEERAAFAGPGRDPGLAAQPGAVPGPVREAGPTTGLPSVDPVDAGGLTPIPAPVGARPEGIRWLQDREAEVAAFVPNYDASLTDRLSAEELARLAPLQADLALNDPTYTLSMAPKGATPFRVGQGRAYADLVLAKQMAGDLWQYRVGSRVANAWNLLFGRVYTKALQDDMKQEFFSDLVTAGATPKQANQLLKALQVDVDQTYLFGSPLHQRLDMLPPKQIDAIAHGLKGDMGIGWQGLPRQVFEKLGEDGVSKALNRSASRIFRKLEQNHRAVDGAGSLGKLLDLTYGPAKAVMDGPVGRGLQYLRAYYPLFRFKLDPRWHLMNLAEARIIGAARYGVTDRQLETGSRTVRAMERTPRGALEGSYEALGDSLASGWLDKRRLDGIIGPAFDVERVASTRKALVALAEDDPIMVTLRERYGRTNDGRVPTPDDLVDELDRMMYDFDTQGVAKTVEAEARKVLDDADYQAMQPMIQPLTRTHEALFRDVIHSFHGNVNRSNVERLANSYFLYWPISYQLKVGKVLFDALTHRMFGRQTDLLGAWTVDRLMREHKDRLVNDPSYRETFEDHPELWRAAGMFLPITPMDIGVSLSRFTRYAGSALGAQLGLWGKDGSYPDITSPRGVLDFGSRIMEMGPLYTSELLATLGRELDQ